MDSGRFIRAVAERSGIERDRAEQVTKATLQTLAERITGTEARDLAAQLPTDLKPYARHAGGRNDGPVTYDVDEFLRRVGERAGGAAPAEAERQAQAVLGTLREAVTDEEFEHVREQLPADFARILPSA